MSMRSGKFIRGDEINPRISVKIGVWGGKGAFGNRECWLISGLFIILGKSDCADSGVVSNPSVSSL